MNLLPLINPMLLGNFIDRVSGNDAVDKFYILDQIEYLYTKINEKDKNYYEFRKNFYHTWSSISMIDKETLSEFKTEKLRRLEDIKNSGELHKAYMNYQKYKRYIMEDLYIKDKILFKNEIRNNNEY